MTRAPAIDSAAGNLAIEIQRATDAAGVPADADLRRWLSLALGDGAHGEVTLRIVDERESAQLNLRYRGKQGPTNVLAFPAEGRTRVADDELPPLGDVLVCASVLAREAAEQHKAAAEHWAHIVIHGGLHLAGHDHATEAEAEVMECRERELLAALGIADPYRVRTG